jgi:hypothetical protein
MSNETIEQKAIKLISKYSPWLKENLLIEEHLYEFDDVAGLIELAIAEEREANKSAYQALREMFNDGEELECDDGWRVGVDIDLWSLGIEALDGLEAPAPKAEVSE